MDEDARQRGIHRPGAAADRLFVSGSIDPDGSGPDPDQAAVASHNPNTGTKQWSRTLAANRYGLNAVAARPDGSRVFTAGVDLGPACTSTCGYPWSSELMTVAYSGTGSKLWTRRTQSEAGEVDYLDSMDISPDGARVFVTGLMDGDVTGVDHQVGDGLTGMSVITVAYKAGGTEQWSSQINDLGEGSHEIGGPDASLAGFVHVSTTVNGSQPVGCLGTADQDIGTVAWDALTGARRGTRSTTAARLRP